MLPVGFALLLLSSTPAALPPALTVAAPRLKRGDELVYAGEIVETCDRPDNRFKKKHQIEVRVFVLEATPDAADCAVMTTLTTLDDDKVAQAVLVVSGSTPARRAPTAHLLLIRVDARGRTRALDPTGAPPLAFAKAEEKALEALPLDAVPKHEVGFFVPLPLEGAKVGTSWAVAEPARPPTVWTAAGESVWNGGRCLESTALQKSTGWDQPNTTPEGWHRSDSVLASPEDGFASVVRREVSRRAGREIVGRIATKYELQQTNRHIGARYAELRNEVEQAWFFGCEPNAPPAKRNAAEGQPHLAKLQRYLDEHPNGTAFRPVLGSLRRRAETAARSAAPPVVPTLIVEPAKPVLLRVGHPAPDFVVPDVDRPTGRFRLSAGKSKPTVVVFFKPGSATSRETLLVAEALQEHFGDMVAVVPLAIGAKAASASRQREELKLKVPVYDGLDVREAYGVTTFPRFFILESTGLLNWVFEAGVGPETGYLVKQRLEELLNRGSGVGDRVLENR